MSEKKTIFPKINYQLWSRNDDLYLPPNWSTTIEKKANTNTKTKQESHIGPKNAKTAQYKNITVKTQQYRIITDYGKYFKNKNAKKNRKPQKPPKKKSTKIRSKKQQKLPFTNMKQNINLTKFTTTDLKQIITEFKLYTIGHNLKKEYTTK